MNTPVITDDLGHVQEVLENLVKINSVNPWITSGAPGEQDAASMIVSWLEALPGVEVDIQEVAPGRPNVVARLRGATAGRRLCINVHTDTVDCLGWEDRAFAPRRDGDHLVGLGVSDNKGQAAALMVALERLSASPAPGETIAVFAADEEGSSTGTRKLVETLEADAALVLEAVGVGNAVVAHQGFGSIDLVVRAAAAHGSEEGSPDAGVQMARLILGLEEINVNVLSQNVDPLAGKAFFHTAWLRGGTDYGTYPAELVLGFEMGTLPGQTLADRLREVEQLIQGLRADDPSLDAELRVALENNPFKAEGHEEIFAAFSETTQEALGRPAEAIGLNTWMDSAIMQGAGIPTLVVGGEGGNDHAIDEWVDLPSLVHLVGALEGSARRFQALPQA